MLRRDFEERYRRYFSFTTPQLALIIEAVSVECIAAAGRPLKGRPSQARCAGPIAVPGQCAQPVASIPMSCMAEDGGLVWRDAAVYRAVDLHEGAQIDGPALITDRHATTVIEPHWQVSVARDSLEIRRPKPAAAQLDVQTQTLVKLELFNNRFMNIAEQMGLRLQNTAFSVNIKERLDFSCALFDAGGMLIANAPHMPVHLGSMSDSIRTVMQRNPSMRAGDVYALNDPYHGGTHLPDITVVTPVYLTPEDASPSFYVASRGHHADVGGTTPGSMPPFSKRIGEEGVLIDNFKLVDAGRLLGIGAL